MTPHLKRWITGAIAVPILFGIIAYGSEIAFAVLIIAASLAGMLEYNRMAFGEGISREKIQTMAIAFVILLTAVSGDFRLLAAVMSLGVMAAMMLHLLRMREGEPDMGPVAKMILGIMYVPLLMSHFILIRKAEEGVLWVFFILVLAFSGDIAAYYAGKGLGRRKLLPNVSPGKTVEGIIGLIMGSIAGCLLFRQLFFPLLPVWHAVVLGLVGSVVGQLGDLCESALKRAAGVKDSGALLPGHGGILDRLDCLMFIAPFVYYYQALIIR
ncbi:MAG: phosphatidate cytidylyltransferase [Proteobacteria bacterium]|nr:phosphatidate cytidylyltransferase [Pseudomonadota bacterium]MBU2260894.1 phosphatidate cytidylyltransferase [Pseudomonadota bacterium]